MVRRKDGLWQEQVTVTENGRKKQRYFYGKTKTAVLRKIADYQEAQAVGPAFETVADEWWEEAEPSLAANSLKNYKPALARAKEHFSGTRIRVIKPTDINLFLREYIKKSDPAEKTAKTQLMVVSLIGKYAVRMGYIDANPARDLSVPKGLRKSSRSVPVSDTIAKIKAGADLPFGLFAYMAMYTGARRGELLALTFEDIDRKNKTIRIDKSLYYEYGKPRLKAPKTENGRRVVPLLDKLAEKLPEGTGPIFSDKGGYITEGRFIMLWREYLKAAGIEHLTPHELRHAYATMLFENNVSVADMQELLGHAQYSTTMDIYNDLRDQRKATVRQQLLSVDIT